MASQDQAPDSRIHLSAPNNLFAAGIAETLSKRSAIEMNATSTQYGVDRKFCSFLVSTVSD